MLRRAAVFGASTALGAATLIFGCSNFSAAPPSLSPDGSAFPDASAVTDAGVTPGVASPADGPVGNGCDATFCEDFSGTLVGPNWDLVNQGGELTIDPDVGAANPPSLQVKVGAPDAPSDRTEALTHHFGSASTVTCSFAMRVDSNQPGTGGVDTFILDVAFADMTRGSLRFGFIGTNFQIRDDFFPGDGGCTCPAHVAGPLGPVRFGTWTNFEVTLGPSQVKVTVDGASREAPAFVGLDVTAIDLTLGVAAFTLEGADIHFDDLVCTAH
jgi:hypothetical protein